MPETRWLLAVVAVCCLALFATSIPEVFTVDDCNYFANVHSLREGTLFVPGIADLTPSQELLPFDPVARARDVDAGRLAPTAPPLYGPLALPFSYLGWRWLILLNVLAFGATALIVFRLARRSSEHRHTAWIAGGLFVLGGFSLDYAQGVWPHMLAVAFVTAAFWMTCRARDDDRLAFAAAGGVLVGMAAGMRYQNIGIAFAIGVTLLLWAKRRVLLGAVYAAGFALPMGVVSLINSVRIGTFNPISKGVQYLPPVPEAGSRRGIMDGLLTLWVRIVDYSAHPPFRDPVSNATLPKSPDTGAFLVVGGLKKALFQSAPWIAIALLAFVLAWASRKRIATQARTAIRAMSVPVVVVLGIFAWAGTQRLDGWCFNQRYLLELVPLFAVTVALLVDDWELEPLAPTLGGAIGLGVAAVPLIAAVPEHTFRQRALMVVPVALAGVLAVVWLLGRSAQRAKAALLAAAVAWAFAVHVGDDMSAARGLRDWNGFQRSAITPHLSAEPSAIISVSPAKESLCPLHLDHDLVLVDPAADKAKDLDRLTGELLGAGRRVFVMGGMPDPWLAAVFRGRRVKMVAVRPIPIGEVIAAEPTPRQ